MHLDSAILLPNLCTVQYLDEAFLRIKKIITVPYGLSAVVHGESSSNREASRLMIPSYTA